MTLKDDANLSKASIPSQLSSQLIETQPVPPTEIEITAPADLNEGFTFDAIYNGQTIIVTVPPGGVKRGQTLRVPFIPVVTEAVLVSSPTMPTTTAPEGAFAVPRGEWRDGICDCCQHGGCETTCCLAFWCSGVVLGQIMRRMKMTWYGVSNGSYASTFKVILALWFIYVVIDFIASSTHSCTQDCDSDNFCVTRCEHNSVSIIFATIAGILSLFFCVMMIVTRNRMREAFDIPGNVCTDCLCAVCCSCCSLVQEARHTHEYKRYGTTNLCSETGLREGAPEIKFDV